MNNLKAIEKSTVPTHMTRAPSITLSREARQSMGKYVEREKLPGEAESTVDDVWKRKLYRTGDGDHTRQVSREGSLRAFSLPSKGNQT